MRIIEPTILIPELRRESYATLKSKYDSQTVSASVLFRPLTTENGSILDFFNASRYSFAFQFFPPNAQIVLDSIKQNQILLLTANPQLNDPNQFQASLAQIDSSLVIPQNFDLAQERLEAQEILNAFANIKEFFLDEMVQEYLVDVENLYKMPAEKIEALGHQANKIVSQINDSRKNLTTVVEIYDYKIKDSLAKEITELFREIGRTQFFASSVKQEVDVDQILSILVKFDLSANVALDLKKENIQTDLETAASQMIKNYLSSSINF